VLILYMWSVYAGIKGIDVTETGQMPYRLFSPFVRGKHRIILPDETSADTVAEACRRDKQLFEPAYVFHAVNNALPEAWPDLKTRLEQGNVKISGTGRLLFLADILNVAKEISMPPMADASIDEAIKYRSALSPKEQKIFNQIISFAYLKSPDPLQRAIAVQIMKKTGMQTSELSRPAKLLSDFLEFSEELSRLDHL
jgi:hypothetical protein